MTGGYYVLANHADVGLETAVVSDPDAQISHPIAKAVQWDFKGKEILGLLRRGARVMINSDDPAYFRGYVCENLMLMAEQTDVTRKELVQFERNAFEISWVSSWQRAKFLEKLEEFEKGWCEGDVDG